MITQDLDLMRQTSDHSARWIAPEIINKHGTYSKKADVFSFAGVMIEVRCRQPTRDKPSFIEQRSSLVPLRLVTNHLTRLCWQSSMGNARHGLTTRV